MIKPHKHMFVADKDYGYSPVNLITWGECKICKAAMTLTKTINNNRNGKAFIRTTSGDFREERKIRNGRII